MNTVTEDVKDLLVFEGYVYFIGDDPPNPHNRTYACSIGFEPDNPVKVVSLYDTGGYSLYKTFGGVQNNVESFQIRARSLTYKQNYDILQPIQEFLNSKGKYAVPGKTYRYEDFRQVSCILPLGKDENNRWLATLNFTTIRMVN
jgi:hypothetical protein